MPASPQRRNALLAIAFVLLWNSGFVGAEFGLDYTGVFTLLSWRYWLLAGVLLVYLLLRKQLRWPGSRAAGLTAVVGLIAHGVWLSCVMLSLQLGIPAGVVALVIALQPMTVGALSGPVTGEPTSASSWVGLVVGFAGVLIAVLGRARMEEAPSLLLYLLPFGAVIAFTIASLLQRRIEVYSPADHLPVALALFYQCLATALVTTIPALAIEGLATRWTPEFLAVLGWLIFAVSLAAYGFMWQLIERMDATRVASLFYFGPPVTMIMAWIALGDTLQASDLVGLAVIAAGVLLVHGAGHFRARR
jgi:drug/metabolite transporter (DMT)-like permease